ncbi:hypothetical protein BLOT_002721 [Blomia tropicalis]|nr:hypothetical protein BLOT_002721 [Blomia tropicalis]
MLIKDNILSRSTSYSNYKKNINPPWNARCIKELSKRCLSSKSTKTFAIPLVQVLSIQTVIVKSYDLFFVKCPLYEPMEFYYGSRVV